MRLLVLYPNLTETKVPPHYVRLLANNLSQAGHILYGPRRPNYNPDHSIPHVVNELGPFDAILCLEQKYAKPWAYKIDKVRIPKVLLLTDYVDFKGQVKFANEFLNRADFDLLFYHTAIEGQNLDKFKRPEKSIWIPFGIDASYFKNLRLHRTFDACAIWCDNPVAYPERLRIKEFLRDAGVSVSTNKVFGDDYVMALNRSKICISSGTIYRNMQSRFMEATACGCMLLTDRVEELEDCGFVDGNNLALYYSPDDCIEKVKWYASHDIERERIAANGEAHVLKHFRNEILIRKIEIEISKLIEGQ